MSKQKKEKSFSEKRDEFLSKTLDKMQEKEAIRKEHHIVLWLILCAPVGIYKSIKYKGFSKIINVLFCLIFLLLTSSFLMFILNPYDLENPKIKTTLESYEETYGELLEYKLIDNVTLNSDDYYVYECFTKLGLFNLYLNTDNDFKIDYVSSYLNRSIVTDNGILEDFDHKLYNEMFLFFQDETVVDKFGELTGILDESEYADLLYSIDESLNLAFQAVETTKGRYLLGALYNQVIQVYDLDNENELVYQRKPDLRIPNETMKVLNKNKKKTGTITTVFGFQWTSTGSYYYFTNEEGIIFEINHTEDDKYILNWGSQDDADNPEEYENLFNYINQFEEIG